MASKKKAGKKIASQADIDRMLAEDAEEESSRASISEGNFISIKGSSFTYQGADLGESMEVVIVDFANEKNWYDGNYDPDELVCPACFSILKCKPNEMTASENSPKEQCDECGPCWANEYGSADKGGGKACREYRRIAIIDVSDISTLMKKPKDVEVAYIKVPPTSLKAFDKMAKGVRKLLKRPLYGVLVEITFDESYDYPNLLFNATKPISDGGVVMALRELRESIVEDILSEPDPDNYKEPKAKKPKKKGGKKGRK